jgi:hypothetical protein
MTVKEAVEIMKDGSAVSGLANCHHKGLYSIVLREREGGQLDRVFYASNLHTMDRVFRPDGHFTIGAHNHDKPLEFKVIFGDVYHILLLRGDRCYVRMYKYPFNKSALETGEFSIGEPEPQLCAIHLLPLDYTKMDTRTLHSVLVPSTSAAWLVTEGPQVETQRYIYSPRPDLKLDNNGLYIPLDQKSIKRVCNAIVESIK